MAVKYRSQLRRGIFTTEGAEGTEREEFRGG
jgi:hypothetical protein